MKQIKKSPLGNLGVKKGRVYTSSVVGREFIKKLKSWLGYCIIFYLDGTFLKV
jgi:hypothetical protein